VAPAANARGGVAIAVRDSLAAEGVQVWRSRGEDGVIWLELAGTETPWMIGCSYLPPQRSGGCPRDIAGWFDRLAEDVTTARSRGRVLLAGDFNSRVGEISDQPPPMGRGDDLAESAETVGPRTSCDSVVNGHGRALIAMCHATGLRIVNGRVAGDCPAQATSHGTSGDGCSVVDLILACPQLLPQVETLSVAPSLVPGYDHKRLVVCIRDNARAPVSASAPPASLPVAPALVVDPARLPAFKSYFEQPWVRDALAGLTWRAKVASSMAALEMVVQDYEDIITRGAAVAGMQPRTEGQRWCPRALRPPRIQRQVQRARARRTRAWRTKDVEAANTANRDLRRLAQQKRRLAKGVDGKRLEKLLREDPGRFYRTLRNRGSATPAPINPDCLAQHFRNLLSAETPVHIPVSVPSPSQMVVGGLEQTPFTVEEAAMELQRTRNGGAVVGSLKPQLLKAAGPVVLPSLVECMNTSVRLGRLPARWATSTITAIPKAGGDPFSCDGYRGIAVGTLAAKIYASIINSRVAPWAEEAGIRAEGQFGFRRDRGCDDAAFVMRSLIDRARMTKRNLYVCFVDFRKAYDSVPRHLLWTKLARCGVSGWVLDAIKTLYSDSPMRVKTSAGVSAPFATKVGVKQGCPLSPLLFGLYLDDWERELEASQHDYDFPTLGGSAVPCVMYADDLAQPATSVMGLRRQMAHLEDYALRWGLTLNPAKTKVVVFGAKKATMADETVGVSVGGSVVEVVHEFSYLGMALESSTVMGGSVPASRAQSGVRAMHNLRRRMTSLRLLDISVQHRLFDVMVESVLSYGAAVWSPEVLSRGRSLGNPCEKVHLSFLRGMLGVRQATAGSVVLAEVGRWPLERRWVQRTARFYNKLVSQPESSLLRRALVSSADLAALSPNRSVHQSWLAHWRDALALWNVPLDVDCLPTLHVGDVVDRWETWYLDTVRSASGTKIHHYVHGLREGLPLAEYGPAEYLDHRFPRSVRRALTQFRVGSHFLHEETGRWRGLSRGDRTCDFCAKHGVTVVEDVHHMVFSCPRFEHVREQYPDLYPHASLSSFFKQSPRRLLTWAHKCSSEIVSEV